MLLVETKSIDRVDYCTLVCRVLLAVTLKAKTLRLAFVFLGHIVDSDLAATLDRADTESLPIREAVDGGSWELECGLKQVGRVKLVSLEALL